VRFFYLNDDVFFGAPVKLDDRFWDGGVYAAWSDEPEVEDGSLRRDADSMDHASRLSRQWLSQAFATPPPSDLPVLPVLPRVVPYEEIFSTFRIHRGRCGAQCSFTRSSWRPRCLPTCVPPCSAPGTSRPSGPTS